MTLSDNVHNLKLIKEYLNIIVEGINDEKISKYSICLLDKKGCLIYETSNFTEDIHLQGFSKNVIKEIIPITDKDENITYLLNIELVADQCNKVIKTLVTMAVKAIQKELAQNQYLKEIEDLNHKLDLQNKLYEDQTKLLNFILDHTKERVLIMDEKGRYVLFNKSAKELMKQQKIFTLDDVYNNFKVYDSDGKRISRDEDPILSIFDGKFVKDFQVSLEEHDGNGEKNYIHVNAILYKDESDRNLSVEIIDDITNYVQLEEMTDAYRNKVTQLNTIIETISDGVCVINAEGECIVGSSCNHHNLFPCIIGCCKEDKPCDFNCHKSINNYKISKEDGTIVDIKKYLLQKLFEGKRIKKEVFIVKSNGKKHFIELRGNPVFNEDGEVDYVVISIHDITKTKEQEVKINYQNEFINNVIDALGAPVTVISYPDHKYKYVNTQYLQILSKILRTEVTRGSVIGKSIYEIIPSEYIYLAEEEIDLNNLIPKTKTVSLKTSDGEIKHYQTIHTPLKYSNKKINIIIVGMDITPQIQLQKDMEALTKSKEEYFTTVSHELRSPIAVINSVAQMLLSEYYKDEFNDRTKKFVGKIEKNSQRLLRLVNNFLDITKAEAGFMSLNLDNINIKEYTKSMVDSILPIGNKKNIGIIFDDNCKTEVIGVDIEKYERILFNLLSNAIKFTKHQGTIEVYVAEEKKYVKVGVKDSGIGIPEKELDKIFDRFYMADHSSRRPHEGTGIGLSLVKKLAELMEGKLEVKSIEGQGSEFMLYLPKCTAPEKSKEEALNIYRELERDLGEKIFLEFGGLNI